MDVIWGRGDDHPGQPDERRDHRHRHQLTGPDVTHQDLPPGPRLPAAVQTVQALSGWHATFPALRRRYGPTFTVRMLPGPQRYVMFSDPAAIKEIFAGDPGEFSGAKGNEVLRAAMGDRSVMLHDAQEHRRIRRYLMPAFSPAAVAGYRPLVREIARDEVARWRQGSSVATLDRMSAITLEVMLRVVFGVTDGERLDRLRPRVQHLVDVDPVVALGWMYPRLRTLPPWHGHQRNLREVDALIHAEIAARRASPDAADGPDLLSRLMRVGRDDGAEPLADDELRDQLVTLLLAGYETSASALSWTLHELGRDETVRARAQRAADAGDEPYLEACLKEGMRLHPIIDFVARTLTTDRTVGGWRLPAGVTVAPAIMLTHLDEEHFPEPARYRPERFVDGSPPANTWIPFGGGVRRCVGAGFALMEGVVVLTEVLRRYAVVADRPSPNRLRNITNVPRDGAPVRLLPREPAPGAPDDGRPASAKPPRRGAGALPGGATDGR